MRIQGVHPWHERENLYFCHACSLHPTVSHRRRRVCSALHTPVCIMTPMRGRHEGLFSNPKNDLQQYVARYKLPRGAEFTAWTEGPHHNMLHIMECVVMTPGGAQVSLGLISGVGSSLPVLNQTQG